MSQRNRLVVVAVVVAVAVGALALLAGPAVVRRVSHPRDEAAFLHYVNTWAGSDWSSDDPGAGQRDRAWVSAHPADVVAAGQRSCQWLSRQPQAPDVDPSGATALGQVQADYLNQTVDGPIVAVSRGTRLTVLAGAWDYLCWSQRRRATAPITQQHD